MELNERYRELGFEIAASDQKVFEWNAMKSHITKRSSRHKILSWERIELLRSIYSCDDPEWSSLWLAGNGPPECNPTFVQHFERYLYGTYPKAETIRQIVANIAVECDVQNNYEKEIDLLKGLCRLFVTSFSRLNEIREDGYKKMIKRHPLLNFVKTNIVPKKMETLAINVDTGNDSLNYIQ
jgi:hypothetical protein